jgi:hypothetical protein
MELTQGRGIESARRRNQLEQMQNLQNQNTLLSGGLTGDSLQYYGESLGALNAQRRIIPQAVQAEREMLPGMQDYQRFLYGSQSQNLMGIYGGMQDQTLAAQSQYGGQLLGMYGQMGQGATNQAINSLGNIGSGIYNTFGNQALSDLSMGSSLNSQETAQAQQSARAAAQSRGLNFSRQGMDMEVLNTYSMGQNRQNQRRQAATQAYGMAQGQQTYGGQAYLNPAMQQSSVYSMPGLLQATQGSFQQMGTQFLQPESQYLANIRANRIQQENADKAAAAQRSAGAASGIGSIISGGLMALAICWVAREVYGTEDGKWTIFRSWLLTEAPEWLFKLYAEHGEEFAHFISDKPMIKYFVRKAMDLVVKRHFKKLAF